MADSVTTGSATIVACVSVMVDDATSVGVATTSAVADSAGVLVAVEVVVVV